MYNYNTAQEEGPKSRVVINEGADISQPWPADTLKIDQWFNYMNHITQGLFSTVSTGPAWERSKVFRCRRQC